MPSASTPFRNYIRSPTVSVMVNISTSSASPLDGLDQRPKLAWLVLAGLLVVFIVLKLPVLKIPYFWDELNVYATGSLYMHDHGIGILPAQLDPEYSRGHPLLSYAYTAIFYKLFGDSVAVGHTSAILMAAAVLWMLFRTGKRVFGTGAALGGVAVLICQPIFFSMAGVIYPEMLLALVVVWGIYALAAGRWGQFAIAGSLAVLTKEPGLILPAAAGVYWLADLIRTKAFRAKQTWMALLALLTPVGIYGLFLVIQKVQNGWYFFPYHLELIHSDAGYMIGIVRRLLEELFAQQGRWLVSVPLLISLVFFRKVFPTTLQQRYVWAFVLVLLFTLLFASVNFYLARYWIFVYPSFILLGIQAWVGLSRHVLKQRGWMVAILGMAAAGLMAVRRMDGKSFADNYDMAYVYTVHTVQDCIDWMQTQPAILSDTPRVTFPIFEALRDPRNGYVTRPIPHSQKWDAPSRFFLIYRLPYETIPDFLNGKEVKRFQKYDNTIYVFDTRPPVAL